MNQRLALHIQFFKSLERLSTTDQGRVRQAIELVSQGYAGSGLRRHKVGPWISLSASMDLRIIVAESNAQIVLAHVGHHDEAYRWAENRKPVFEPDGTFISILPDIKSDGDHVSGRGPMPETVDKLRFHLPIAGLPTVLAKQLSVLPESDLLEAISWLAPELQEIALAGLAGAPNSSSPLPARPSDILVVNDDRILEFALSLPAQTWRIFLHPKQRYVVDLPEDRHVLVKGGPGTGKTVAIAHRFAHLYSKPRNGDNSGPVFIVLNNVTRGILRCQLEELGVNLPEHSIRLVSDLPKSRKRLLPALQQWSHIVIDEGQDLPVHFVSAVCEFVEDGHDVPPLTVSYDANQAIFHPSEVALNRLGKLSDFVSLSYCYRATKQLADLASSTVRRLHVSYSGRGFQHRHRVASARDPDTTRLVAALAGPEVEVTCLTSRERLPVEVRRIARALLERYRETEGLAIIVVGSQQDGFVRELRSEIELFSEGIPVYSYWTAKGQEFFAGMVIDAIDYAIPDDESVDADITFGRYKMLSGLYVAISRFRDSLSIATFSKSSPVWPVDQKVEGQ